LGIRLGKGRGALVWFLIAELSGSAASDRLFRNCRDDTTKGEGAELSGSAASTRRLRLNESFREKV
jgi:hypothetical protein